MHCLRRHLDSQEACLINSREAYFAQIFSAFFIMPDTCCATGCTNRRSNVSDRIPGVKYPSFFRIPKDSNRRREWMAKISRKVLPETAKICSDHFVTGILPFGISIILCL